LDLLYFSQARLNPASILSMYAITNVSKIPLDLQTDFARRTDCNDAILIGSRPAGV
jgi:hypothetical protein